MKVPYALGSCLEALVSYKLVYREVCSEDYFMIEKSINIQTTKLGTDEQEPYTRHISLGKQAHLCNAPRIPKKVYVDTAAIE